MQKQKQKQKQTDQRETRQDENKQMISKYNKQYDQLMEKRYRMGATKDTSRLPGECSEGREMKGGRDTRVQPGKLQ
ncbi:hypothetical protein WR25_17519 [Diploscapter pachys]|uniref:Uncharacterized protein n=1 Tax=Diploscapter pachys TaxID=2018661 RepID=A0A2A2L6L7_9BILA|nr:hypothetical protein WR25_17519 [Diploscapter pachys]